MISEAAGYGLCILGGVAIAIALDGAWKAIYYLVKIYKQKLYDKLYGDHEIIKLQSNINSLKHNAHMQPPYSFPHPHYFGHPRTFKVRIVEDDHLWS